MGAGNKKTYATRLNGVQVQSSVYGQCIPWGMGTNRVSANAIYFNDFNSVEVKNKASGGKGGASGTTSITYNYYATVIMAIGLGPIQGVSSVYRDGSVFNNSTTTALQQAGLTLFTGDVGQAPWSYLVGAHPSDAISYSGVAYLAASGYALDSNAGLENHTFEVEWGGSDTVISTGDCNGADVLTNFVTIVPQWPSGLMGDLTGYKTYCRAQNLFVSPLLDTQTQASQFISDLLEATNSDAVWSDGQLQIVPYGDLECTANGSTYIPDITPVYDLTDDDLIVDQDGKAPISVSIGDKADAPNITQVQFNDRANQYNNNTVTGRIDADIDIYGERTDQSPVNLPMICNATVAQVVANLRVNQLCYVRDTYSFTLPWNFDILNVMDVVTLTDPGLGLDRQLVRITQIDEGQNFTRSFTAVGIPVGAAHSPIYETQGVGGYSPNYDASPGSVSTPVLFNPPASLTGGSLQVWGAVAGLSPNWGGANVYTSLDGSTYKMIGTISGSARYGVLTSSLPSGSDPDTAHSFGVDLSISNGQLTAGTDNDADTGTTLCWVGGELISYSSATLTSSNNYTLGTYVRRGQNQTPIVSHASGTDFVRLDSSIFTYDYLAQQVGQTLYVKFTSFNVFGRAIEDLADVTAYTITLELDQNTPIPVAGLELQGPFNTTQFTVIWQASENTDSYTINLYESDGTTLLRSVTSYSTAFSYTQQDAYNDGYLQRSFVVEVIANNDAGSSAPTQITVTNAAPAVITGVAETGSGTSRAVTWNSNTEVDVGGYIAMYSSSTGFDPTIGEGSLFYQGANTMATLSNLIVGDAYYIRVAAYDSWTSDPSTLIFSPQLAFTA